MKRFSIRAAYIGKSLANGAMEYRSRLTGRRYTITPLGEGFVVSSNHHSDAIVTSRRMAFRTIELDELL